MKIKTITCHDVYNVGASLQAYALVKYLRNLGHQAEIIDYKPLYLQHYQLTGVASPQYDKPVLREIYQLIKLPGRIAARKSRRKKNFDIFTEKYLPITSKTYTSIDELKANTPEADIYIAGSDQIWNPLFQNGKDPSFFLQFAPNSSKRISYAASFAVDDLAVEDSERMRGWLKSLNAISVREKSGVQLLSKMGLHGVQVCDPVFLLERTVWEKLAICPKEKKYLLVYDFDNNPEIRKIASELAKKRDLRIISVFPMEGADGIYKDMGPLEFVGTVLNADTVLSNSFHATAFSLMFQKDFFVVNRKENINTRMQDLLESVGLSARLIRCSDNIDYITAAEWKNVEQLLVKIIEKSKQFLDGVIN